MSDEESAEIDRSPFVEAQLISHSVVTSDAFSGGGHGRTARALANTIKRFSQEDAAIGLEGKFGAGKSVVIAVTQDELEKDQSTSFEFKVFTFDLWSHQTESFKRGYLEELITWASPEGQNLLDTASVKELRRDIRDRTVTIESTRLQRFHWFAFVLLLFAPLLPLVVAWASPVAWNGLSQNVILNLWFLPDSFRSWRVAQFLLILLYALFFVAVLTGMGHRKRVPDAMRDGEQQKSDWGANLGRALAQAVQPFHTDKAQTHSETQIIREEDPSTLEFQKLFRRTVKAIQTAKPGRKPVRLVLVFDNIDRLAEHRIPDVWGEVRSIFVAGIPGKFERDATITAIVPYDLELIDRAYSSAKVGHLRSESRGSSPGQELVSKTFAAILRVAPPIGFDSRQFFSSQLREATKEQLSENQEWLVHRLFHLSTLQDPIPPTPRQMISFINRLAVLWNERQGDIPLESLALYVVCSSEIAQSPRTIFKGEETWPHLIELCGQDEWQSHLAAIYYNVSVDHVLPVLMRREIEATLMEGEPDRVLELGKRRYFADALLEFVREYQDDFNIGDIQSYANLLGGMRVLSSGMDSPAIAEAWRLLVAVDPYAVESVLNPEEALTNLASRMANIGASGLSVEANKWLNLSRKSFSGTANAQQKIVRALERAVEMLDEERARTFKTSVVLDSWDLQPNEVAEFTLSLASSSTLDVSWYSPGRTEAAEKINRIVDAFGNSPVEAQQLAASGPHWLIDSVNTRVCEKLSEFLFANLPSTEKASHPALNAIWSFYEKKRKATLDALQALRDKGGFVLLFRHALQNQNVEIAAKAFILEFLLSKDIAAPQYTNHSFDGVGSVHEAVAFYNEHTGDTNRLPDAFVLAVSTLVERIHAKSLVRELALKSSETSVFREVFRQTVRLGAFSTPAWDKFFPIYSSVKGILGDELFADWLKACSGEGMPGSDVDAEQRRELLHDAERLEVEAYSELAEAENRRFQNFSQDQWLALFRQNSDELSLLHNQLISVRWPLLGLASNARLAILEHVGRAVQGEEEWLREPGIYDRLLSALNDTSRSELPNALMAEILNEPVESQYFREFRDLAPKLYSQVPIQSQPDAFVRNIVSPFLDGGLDLLAEWVEIRGGDLAAVAKGCSGETLKLLKDDLSAAYRAADAEVRESIDRVAGAMSVEIERPTE